MQRLRGCGPPDGGYSVVKVQLKEAFIYSDICDPESQGTGERFLKILSLIRKWGGGKVNPGSETFFESPFTNSDFQPPFCKPSFRKNFWNHFRWCFSPSPEGGVSVLNSAEEKSLHISGLLRGSKSTHRKKYFWGGACDHHLLLKYDFQKSLHVVGSEIPKKATPCRNFYFAASADIFSSSIGRHRKLSKLNTFWKISLAKILPSFTYRTLLP